RAALAVELREDGKQFHIGVLLDNVPDYIFWLGAAALAGATLVGINSTKRGATLEAEVRHADLSVVVTDEAGLELLGGLDIGVPRERFVLAGQEYPPAGPGGAAGP